jgi:hypothetical protein
VRSSVLPATLVKPPHVVVVHGVSSSLAAACPFDSLVMERHRCVLCAVL